MVGLNNTQSTATFEMGMADDASVVSQLSAIPEYRKKFNQVFGKQAIRLPAPRP